MISRLSLPTSTSFQYPISLNAIKLDLLPKKEGGKILVYFLLLSNTNATAPTAAIAITAIAIATSVLISGCSG
jgi:hypothetical protein